MVIQQLLAEAGTTDHDHELTPVDASGAEAPADWASLRSPETYTGYERTENFASPGGAVPGKHHLCQAPDVLRLNHLALSGDWTMEEQAVTLNEAGGQIVCRFHARDLHLVMGPAAPAAPVPFRVRIDGQPPVFTFGLLYVSCRGTDKAQRRRDLAGLVPAEPGEAEVGQVQRAGRLVGQCPPGRGDAGEDDPPVLG
jgi:hypothetical protein